MKNTAVDEIIDDIYRNVLCNTKSSRHQVRANLVRIRTWIDEFIARLDDDDANGVKEV